ncbi:hypothetical protein [Gordonia crocea]|uniref:Transmembrane protein n=1 Tax=Gordonia crocea TaxID=589162 RepID=A0A7I9UVV1_9ACTN|nr:hypothetical protein [Gordonia crocea]GED96956.1 hypothetical protein nbrc107697_09950 [Gordonia crocea]
MDGDNPDRRILGGTRTIAGAAVALIAVYVVVRIVLAATGGFYWDDLILIGRASTHNVFGWDYLAHNHDGHFMPGAFFLAGLATLLAPTQWWPAAVTLVVLATAVAVAVWRMITIVASGRPRWAQVVVLAFFLFTPMTVPSYVWWAAGLNTLPMQFAMAWLVGDAVLLCAGVSHRQTRIIVWRSALIYLVALTCFEKALYIVPVVFAATVLWCRFGALARERESSVPGPLAAAFVGAKPLWQVLAPLTLVWAVVFLSVTGGQGAAGRHSMVQALHLTWRSVNNAVIPSLVGGPWNWDRWIPSPPMGFAPVWQIVAGWVLLAVAVVVMVRLRRGAWPVIVAAAVYVVAAQFPVMWNRSSANTALELAQTMRYLPDAALVMTLGLALVLACPRPAVVRRRPVLPIAAAVVVVLVASSGWGLWNFQRSWRNNPTPDYLATARASLASDPDRIMFDQALPLEILTPVAYPENQISHTFGRIRPTVRFGAVTDDLKVLDQRGRLVPGGVTPARTFAAGRGSCTDPEVRSITRIPLSGPLIEWRWTVALSYCANRDGRMSVQLAGGEPVVVDVRAGLHVVYVQSVGRGTAIALRPLTAGLRLHTGEGRVGEVAEAALLK